MFIGGGSFVLLNDGIVEDGERMEEAEHGHKQI